jgi:hypothetical protein
VLVLAVILVLGISVVLLLRASGVGRRESSEPLAEPGSEGMHVADDGEIAPGAAGRTAD